MKVLYIVTAYPRSPEDVITPWLVETIARLKRAGVDVEVLAPSYRALPGGDVGGVRVHRFRYAPRAWERLTHEETAPDRVRRRPWYLALVPGYVLGGMWAAGRLARTGAYDVVHVHWPVPHALMGLAARWAGRIPLICTFHGVELTWTRSQLPFLAPFLRWVIRAADAVTVNSRHTESLVRSFRERDVVRIPFGAAVDPSAAQPPGSRQERDGTFELLFVGRLVERKGVAYLLDALRRLRERHDVALRVIGEGPLRPALERQADELGLASAARFEGFVSAAELAAAYGRCDAFVLPAVVDGKGDTEGLGVVLVEALSQGRPVVASAVGGITDLVTDGETGLLVPPGDAGALAIAIERLIDAPARARALGRAGRALVEREFAWPAIIGRLVALYESVRARGGKPS